MSCKKTHECACTDSYIYNQKDIYDSTYTKTTPELSVKKAKDYCNSLDNSKEYGSNEIIKTDCNYSK